MATYSQLTPVLSETAREERSKALEGKFCGAVPLPCPNFADRFRSVGKRARPSVSLHALHALALVIFILAGCSSPAVRQQRLVAKPNMVFSDSSVFAYNSARLLRQLAAGLASSSGSQNSGCTSCR